MKNSFFRLPENMTPQARNAFLIATAIASAHFVAVPYYLFLVYQGQTTAIAQFYTLAAITVALGVLIGIGAVLSRRGQPTLGMILVLSTLAVSYPPISATLVGGLGLVLGLALMAVGPMSAFQVLPRRSGLIMTIVTIVSGLATLLLDVFGSTARPSLPGIVIQLLAASVVGLLGFLIVRYRIFLSGFLANISIAWKMVLMVSVLFLGMAGITISAYVGIQSLRYQFSNIYDFMLIPITSIEEADTALIESQYYLVQVLRRDITAEERANGLAQIQASNQSAENVIARYDTEWVTTASPQFTQDLKSAGKLELQQQEVATLAAYHTAYNAYKTTVATYLATVQARNPDAKLANDAIKKLEAAHTELDKLIEVNNQFADFSNTSAEAAIRQALLTGGIALGISVALGLLMSLLVVISITGRLGDLTRSAAAMQEGKLDQTVAVAGRDEVALLGTTFNKMAAQLREFIGTLESRVAERTQSLELAAEVGRSVSQVRALDVMLKDAAELIRSRFDLYYVQVYLTDPNQTNLILQSGTGTVGAELLGRGHRLPLNTASINGRAAVEKRSVVVEDTAASAAFRPNPLLPDTRSEMAVPLLIGEKVVGVLDLQSREAGTLNQDILTAFEALAGQLAIAIQNATFLAETQQARAEVEAQARRLTRANWDEYMDAIHQPEEMGFVLEQNKIMSLTEDQQTRTAENSSALVAPIAVTGESLGNLIVEMEGDSPIARTNELINTVARQVSQQIENLRLLENAERYRAEAEGASRRITREGWKDYTDANAAKGLSYIYDLKEVRPLKAGDQQAEESAVSLPLKVRDETVGRLLIQGLGSDDSEALELASAVAERLSAHIENLRLSEQTQERAQREHALRQITSAVRGSTDPATILRAAVRELGTLLGRKTVIRLETTREAQASQTDFIANSGDETVLPAGSPNAIGGDE
jgi:GAF domain-containing protein/HAMP domain-containing protein